MTPAGKARILSLVWYKVLPAWYGGQKGIVGFTRALAREHEVIMLCSRDNAPDAPEPFQVLPLLPTGRTQFLHLPTLSLIARTIREQHITHLIIEHPYYAPLLSLLDPGHRTIRILHAHNIEYDLFRSNGARFWRLLKVWEGMGFRKADRYLFKTEEDLHMAVSKFHINPASSFVIPYGTERDTIPDTTQRAEASRWLRQKHALSENESILLFTGTLDYRPNAEAVEHIVSILIPGLERAMATPFRVIVTGRIRKSEYKYLLDLSHPRLILAGEVPDPFPYLAGADLMLNPVVRGGGIKVKVIDSIAHGLPVVSTRSGATGIRPEDCGNMLSVGKDDDPAELIPLIVKSLAIKERDCGDFYGRYTWKAILGRTPII